MCIPTVVQIGRNGVGAMMVFTMVTCRRCVPKHVVVPGKTSSLNIIFIVNVTDTDTGIVTVNVTGTSTVDVSVTVTANVPVTGTGFGTDTVAVTAWYGFWD